MKANSNSDTDKFIKDWAKKRRGRNDGRIHGGSKLGPPEDREPSPCLGCKQVRKESCIEPCHRLRKWMERVFSSNSH
jgi:hypothetical protein